MEKFYNTSIFYKNLNFVGDIIITEIKYGKIIDVDFVIYENDSFCPLTFDISNAY